MCSRNARAAPPSRLPLGVEPPDPRQGASPPWTPCVWLPSWVSQLSVDPLVLATSPSGRIRTVVRSGQGVLAPLLRLSPDVGVVAGVLSAGRTFHCGTSCSRGWSGVIGISAFWAATFCRTPDATARRFASYESRRPAGARPRRCAASFQPRFIASWTPRFRPWPPAGKAAALDPFERQVQRLADRAAAAVAAHQVGRPHPEVGRRDRHAVGVLVEAGQLVRGCRFSAFDEPVGSCICSST